MAVSSSNFWRCIDELKIQLRSLNRIEELHSSEHQGNAQPIVKIEKLSRVDVIAKLEEVTAGLLQDISEGRSPSLKYNTRNSWKNVRYNRNIGMEMIDGLTKTEHKFDAVASIGKFSATLRIMAFCYKLLQNDNYATKRDIYYSDVPFYGNQSVVDEIIDNLACMIKVPRHCLHVCFLKEIENMFSVFLSSYRNTRESLGELEKAVETLACGSCSHSISLFLYFLQLAASKGCIAGDLRYKEHDGTHVDCSDKTSGAMVSSHVEGIYDMYSNAKFVLVVEKQASFQRILDDGILKKLQPCIVITGKGFPDVNTRMMVHKLWTTFQIPILGLVDADPHGIEILSVYKFGSKSLSFDAHSLTVPVIQWLGVLPSDLCRLSIPQDSRIPLTTKDRNKAHELLKRPYIMSLESWIQEIETMLTLGFKAEIQALSSISFEFLTDTYLPVKIKNGRWI